MTHSPCQRQFYQNIFGVLPKILAIAFMASFMSSGVKNPIMRFQIQRLILCIALSLTLLHNRNVSCKCFNERISEVAMLSYFFFAFSSTRTFTTSVRTAIATAFAIVTHIPYSIQGLDKRLMCQAREKSLLLRPRHALSRMSKCGCVFDFVCKGTKFLAIVQGIKKLLRDK